MWQDGSGYVSLVQLEAGLQTLGFPGLSSAQIRQALIEAGCDCSAPSAKDEMYQRLPLTAQWDLNYVEAGTRAVRTWGALAAPGEVDEERPWVMNLEQFVQVYMHSVQRCSSTKTQLQWPWHDGQMQTHQSAACRRRGV